MHHSIIGDYIISIIHLPLYYHLRALYNCTMLRHLLLLLIFMLIASSSYGQIDFGSLDEEQIYRPTNKYNTWSVTVGYGPVIYYTDIVDYTIFPEHNLKFGPSAAIAKQFGRSWAVEGQFLMADMYGQKYRRYFEGDFREVTLNVKAYLNQLIFNGPMRDRWNIYAKAGIGVNGFRSTMRSLGVLEYYDGQPIGVILEPGELITVGYFDPVRQGYPNAYTGWNSTDYLVMGYKRESESYPPLQKTSRQTELIVPVGMGVRYRLNKSFDLGIETTLRNLMADNLDVDMTGADNDSYLYTSVSLTYKIGKKNKRHASWTYKDFNLAYERQRERDPLVQRLDSLRKQLDHLATRDTAVSDTTFISTQELFKNESFSVSIFFDFDKTEINQTGQRALAGVARFMRDNPDAKMLILGYTDDRGSEEYNLRLSQRRIGTVRDLLVKDFGINESRFTIDARGKNELLSDTRRLAPRGVHMVNRRVDIILLND